MKVIKRYKVPKNKCGKIQKTNPDLEPHEDRTVECLSGFGFNVETLIPSDIPKTKNPDLLMLGTTWEMKGPRVANESTIQTKFRKAIKQAEGKAIFDLRESGHDADEIERIIMKMFTGSRGMRRIMIIRNDNELLDIFK